MTLTQERAISLALNILQVNFFECPKQYYEYFIDNDGWALLLTAAGLNAADTPPPVLALGVLRRAVSHEGFFEGMTDFKAPAHYCSFLREQIAAGKREMTLEPCKEHQDVCPYATFQQLSKSK